MKKALKSFQKRLGPGIITGAADDDPSGIATYTIAGATLGYAILWTSPFILPFMATIQEMCARIGLVTQHGLAGVMRRYYSKWLLFAVAGAVVIANTINIGADLAAMTASVQLVLPEVPTLFLSLLFTLIIVALIVFGSYRLIARIFKWLTLTLFAYVLSAILAHPDWNTALYHTFIPQIEFNKTFFTTFVAVLGTTISPYLFFWQASEEVEEKQEYAKEHHLKRILVTKNELKVARDDVIIGMTLSNVVFFFIITAAAATLHQRPDFAIITAADAAAALEPLAGRESSLLFALGIIGTGMLAIPVLAGSASYVVSEALDRQESISSPFYQAKTFYGVFILAVLLGFVITLLNFEPIKLLFYTAVLFGLISPPLILVLLHMANNKKLMRDRTNGKLSNILGILTFLLMSFAALALFLS